MPCKTGKRARRILQNLTNYNYTNMYRRGLLAYTNVKKTLELTNVEICVDFSKAEKSKFCRGCVLLMVLRVVQQHLCVVFSPAVWLDDVTNTWQLWAAASWRLLIGCRASRDDHNDDSLTSLRTSNERQRRRDDGIPSVTCLTHAVMSYLAAAEAACLLSGGARTVVNAIL